MKSDTPRTDEKSVSISGFYSCATVPADFAKGLERELNASKAEVDRIRQILKTYRISA